MECSAEDIAAACSRSGSGWVLEKIPEEHPTFGKKPQFVFGDHMSDIWSIMTFRSELTNNFLFMVRFGQPAINARNVVQGFSPCSVPLFRNF